MNEQISENIKKNILMWLSSPSGWNMNYHLIIVVIVNIKPSEADEDLLNVFQIKDEFRFITHDSQLNNSSIKQIHQIFQVSL